MAELIRGARFAALKFASRLIVLLLALLGIRSLSSCSNQTDSGEPSMYVPGPATMVYGTVTGPDADGDGSSDPIEGIAVSADLNGTTLTDTTDEDGHWALYSSVSTESLTVNFADTDGSENGGSFASASVDVTGIEAYSEKEADVTLELSATTSKKTGD